MSTDLAYAILGQLGRDKRADDSLAITGGDDPVFVTPWRIAHAGSAALGAVGLAVSDLWRLQDRQAAGRRHRPPRRRGLAALQHLRAAERQAAGVVGSAGRPLRHARRPHDVPAHQPSAPSRRRAQDRRRRDRHQGSAGRGRRQMGRARHRGGDRRRRLRRRAVAQPRGMERPSARHRRRQAAADRHGQDRRGAGRGRCRKASGR